LFSGVFPSLVSFLPSTLSGPTTGLQLPHQTMAGHLSAQGVGSSGPMVMGGSPDLHHRQQAYNAHANFYQPPPTQHSLI